MLIIKEDICYPKSVILLFFGGNDMKRYTKLASLALALAMVFSLCACTAKPSSSGIVHNSEKSKPERPFGMETEPVITINPTPSVAPDPTTPTVSEPTNTGVGEPMELTVPDLMYISELSIGLPPDQATEFLTAVMGISDYTISDNGSASNGAPLERFLRDLNRDIVVDGVVFKSIGIHCNNNGVVVDVDYTIRETAIFATNEAFDSESYYNKLYPVFCASYGDPSDDYESSWVDFDKSGLYGWKYESYWISLFWGMGCQSVTGNDQLVMGIEYDDPGSLMFNGGSVTKPAATSFNDIYELMGNVVGLELGEAETFLNSAFGITLGKPSDSTTGDETGISTYTYTVDITVDGYSFNEIELDTNKNNVVYHIGLINNKDSGDLLRDYCTELREKTADYLDAEPSFEYPLSEDNDIIEFYDYDFEGGLILTIGAYYTDYYSSLWITFEDIHLANT